MQETAEEEEEEEEEDEMLEFRRQTGILKITLSSAGDCHRVDFHQGGILFDEKLVEFGHGDSGLSQC